MIDRDATLNPLQCRPVRRPHPGLVLTDVEVRALIAFGRFARTFGVRAEADALQITARLGGLPSLSEAAVADALTLLAYFGLLASATPLRAPASMTARFALTVDGLAEIMRRCEQTSPPAQDRGGEATRRTRQHAAQAARAS